MFVIELQQKFMGEEVARSKSASRLLSTDVRLIMHFASVCTIMLLRLLKSLMLLYDMLYRTSSRVLLVFFLILFLASRIQITVNFSAVDCEVIIVS